MYLSNTQHKITGALTYVMCLGQRPTVLLQIYAYDSSNKCYNCTYYVTGLCIYR